MNILEFITEKPITRHELSDLTGLNDRQVREKPLSKQEAQGQSLLTYKTEKGIIFPMMLKPLKSNWHRTKKEQCLYWCKTSLSVEGLNS